MPIIKNRRNAVIAVGVLFVLILGAGVAWFGYWSVVDSRNPYGGHNSYGMRDYTRDVQEKSANAIVAGLNSGNPDDVDLMRNHSGNADREADNARITANIEAVLPPPGCRYELEGIEDKGEQDPAAVPWFGGPTHARGFDMKLRQLCTGGPPTQRTIRVIAIPSGMGGYWAAAALQALN
ncbi:MAG: hypothetical protein E6R06_33270 [Mycobacterium sp.]|nr:MAG: hypothetical protein E6R06_33270 [Mycobacterium sp.]